MIKFQKMFAIGLLCVASLMPNLVSAHDVEFQYINVIEQSEAPEAVPATWVDLDGRQHTLEEFKGKPVILHFWASWCPPCRHEFEALDAWNKAHAKEQGISLVALSGDSSISRAESFINQGDYQIPVRLTDDETQSRWMIRAIPTTYFIDASGHVRGMVSGAVDWADPQMQDEVMALLGDNRNDSKVAQTAALF